MTFLDDVKKIKTADKDIRSFSRLVGGILAAIGIYLIWKTRVLNFPLFGVAAVLAAAGELRPQSLKLIYKLWMSLALVMGSVMSRVLLTVIFFVLVTPIGWITRLIGKRFLENTLDKTAATYWLPKKSDPRGKAQFESQF